jgi:hypothetical protein
MRQRSGHQPRRDPASQPRSVACKIVRRWCSPSTATSSAASSTLTASRPCTIPVRSRCPRRWRDQRVEVLRERSANAATASPASPASSAALAQTAHTDRNAAIRAAGRRVVDRARKAGWIADRAARARRIRGVDLEGPANAEVDRSRLFAWLDYVVPVAVPCVRLDVDRLELLRRDFVPGRVLPTIESGPNDEPTAVRRV